MTLSIGPDEMRNITLSISDVRDPMEALFACQLLLSEEKGECFSSHVDTDDKITYWITLSMFSFGLKLENVSWLGVKASSWIQLSFRAKARQR